MEDMKNELEEINELKEDWEKLELEMVKSSELSWEQKQSIKSTLIFLMIFLCFVAPAVDLSLIDLALMDSFVQSPTESVMRKKFKRN